MGIRRCCEEEESEAVGQQIGLATWLYLTVSLPCRLAVLFPEGINP